MQSPWSAPIVAPGQPQASGPCYLGVGAVSARAWARNDLPGAVHQGSEVDRELEDDRGSLAGGARHRDHSAQRLHAIREAEDFGALIRVRSSNSVKPRMARCNASSRTSRSTCVTDACACLATFAALHQDGAPHQRADAHVWRISCESRESLGVLELDSGGPTRVEDGSPDRFADPGDFGKAEALHVPHRDDGGVAVGLASDHDRVMGSDQPGNLFRDRGEDDLRGHRAGGECRHAPQGGLLLDEPRQLAPRLCVRDRGADQLAEGCRCSLSGGSGSAPVDEARSAPQTRPSTTTGAPTDERMPCCLTNSGIAPESPSKLSTRAGPPDRSTASSHGQREGRQEAGVGVGLVGIAPSTTLLMHFIGG